MRFRSRQLLLESIRVERERLLKIAATIPEKAYRMKGPHVVDDQVMPQ